MLQIFWNISHQLSNKQKSSAAYTEAQINYLDISFYPLASLSTFNGEWWKVSLLFLAWKSFFFHFVFRGKHTKHSKEWWCEKWKCNNGREMLRFSSNGNSKTNFLIKSPLHFCPLKLILNSLLLLMLV